MILIDRLAPRLGGGVFVADPAAAEREQQHVAARRRARELERANNRHRFVEERGRLEQMIAEAIARLDLRRLRKCSADQRVAARGLADRLREVCEDVTAARTSQDLSTAEHQARDPLRRAGELLSEIDRERETRRQIETRVEPTRRSRRPDLAPARDVAQLITALLPGANGSGLETLDQDPQQFDRQLGVAPPVSEEQRRRDMERLALNARYVPGYRSPPTRATLHAHPPLRR